MNLTAADKRKPSINQHANFKFLTHEGILTWLAVLLVYSPALFTYFSQDDFTHLLLSKVGRISEVWKFFVPIEGGIFYRPLSVQFVTWLVTTVFGLKPFWFHWLALLIHGANIVLVFKLLSRFTVPKLARLGAFIYGVHPVHFMSLFWMAEFSMVLAPLFAFAAILAFLDKKHVRFLIFMLLGLLSNELMVMVPVILLLKRRSKWLIPALMMAGLLLTLRFWLVPTSLGSEYVLSFSLFTWLNNLRWQVMRSLGLPEGFRAYLNWPSVQIALIFLVGFWGIWLSRVRLKPVWWGLGWYMLALLPVLFLAHHQSPIYQIIGLPGFILMMLAWGQKLTKHPAVITLLAGLFFVSSFWSVRAMDRYHWVTKRARLAKYHLEKLENHKPQTGQTITFLNTIPKSSTEVYMALAGGKAIKVFFGNNPAFFEDFDGDGFPTDSVLMLSRTESQMR